MACRRTVRVMSVRVSVRGRMVRVAAGRGGRGLVVAQVRAPLHAVRVRTVPARGRRRRSRGSCSGGARAARRKCAAMALLRTAREGCGGLCAGGLLLAIRLAARRQRRARGLGRHPLR